MQKCKKSILEQLYDGELFSIFGLAGRNPAYNATCQQVEKEHRYLAEKLNDEDKEHLENFSNLLGNMSGIESFAHFACGFRYGMLLMQEMLAEVEKDTESR